MYWEEEWEIDDRLADFIDEIRNPGVEDEEFCVCSQ